MKGGMASVSVPLTFAKTNNHAARRWTPSSRQATFDIQTQRKEARGQQKSLQNAPTPDDACKIPGI